jgi:hypothetical protein
VILRRAQIWCVNTPILKFAPPRIRVKTSIQIVIIKNQKLNLEIMESQSSNSTNIIETTQ